MTKTIEQNINEIRERNNKWLDEIIKGNTSQSANTFKDHIKEVGLNDLDWRLKTSFFSTIRRPSDYEQMKGIELPEQDAKKLWERSHMISTPITRSVQRLCEKYTSHRQLFKNLANEQGERYFSPLDWDNIEQIEDGIDHRIYQGKVRKYAQSFLRSYKHLLNDESYQIFSEIYDGKYDRDYVAKEIRKIAKFKSSEDLNNALTKIIEGEKTPEYIKETVEDPDLNASIVYHEGNKIVVEVEDFAACQKLGSSEWCIANNDDDFYGYLYTKSDRSYEQDRYFDSLYGDTPESELPSRQMIYYDFDRPPTDPDYMIGLTISAGFELVAAHNKNDDDVMEELFETTEENDVLECVLKQIPYCHEEAVQKILEGERSLLSWIKDETALAEIRNPLNTMLSIEKHHQEKTGESLYEATNGACNLDQNLIKKSLEEYKFYGDIDAQQMTRDLLNAYITCSKLESVKNDFEFSKAHSIGPDHLLRLDCVEIFFNQLHDLQKNIILKNNEDLFNEFLISYDTNKRKQYEQQITPSSPDFMQLFNMKVLNSFEDNFSHLILESSLVNNQSKAFIAYYESVKNPSDEKMNDKLIGCIEKGDVHPFNILKDPQYFTEKVRDKTVEKINEGLNDSVLDLDNGVLQKLAIEEKVLDNLSPQTCQLFKESIKAKGDDFGCLQPIGLESPLQSFAERMKNLKDKKIIDDEIIEKNYKPENVASENRQDEDLFLRKVSRPETKLR